MNSNGPDKRILQIGESPRLNERCQEVAQLTGPLWKFSTASNHAGAPETNSGQMFDAVVLEARDDDPGWCELLTALADQHPHALRLLWCRPKDIEGYRKRLGDGIYYLSDQWDAGGTECAMRRCFLRAELEQSEPLRALVERIGETPRLPRLYRDLVQRLESPDSDLETVAQLLASDPASCAALLKCANSALYGLPRQVSSGFDAVMTLGMEQTKAIVLYSQLLGQFDAASCPEFSADHLWQHALQTASFAGWITKEETGSQPAADEAYTAGLLHDLGKLILAANLPAEFGAVILKARAQRKPLREMEQETFGTTHAELGALLMARWELPFPIVEAIAWHHAPLGSASKLFTALSAVYVANVFYHELEDGKLKQSPPKIDAKYLLSLSKFDRLAPWRNMCGIPQAEAPGRLKML